MLFGEELTNVVFVPQLPTESQQQRRLSRSNRSTDADRERPFLPITSRVVRHIPFGELAYKWRRREKALVRGLKQSKMVPRTGILEVLMGMSMLVRRPSTTGTMRMNVSVRCRVLVSVSVQVFMGGSLSVKKGAGEPVLELAVGCLL